MPKFVVEWEGFSVDFIPFTKIWTSEDWYARPVSERHLNCVEIWGQDELDVYVQLLKLEEQNNDR
jgi:hypothetical protein